MYSIRSHWLLSYLEQQHKLNKQSHSLLIFFSFDFLQHNRQRRS